MHKFISDNSNQNNATLEYIRELEEKLEIRFPDILVDYYMNYNHAKMKEFSFFVHGLEFSVEFILPLKDATMCVENILSFKDEEYVPKSFIPLAEDIDAEEYYWDASTGRVYFLSMENVENPIPICDSVEQFFDILNESCE